MKLIYLILIVMLFSFACAENISITKQDAQLALEESLLIIKDFNSHSFPLSFINDSYYDASRVFQQVSYLEILNNVSLPETDSLKIEARSALRFTNLKNLSYSQVIVITDKIVQHNAEAYTIYDTINIMDKKINNYTLSGVNVSIARDLLNSANNSFYLDQFSDSMSYMDKTRVQLESDFEKMSTLSILAANTKTFIYRYWPYILGILSIFAIISFIFIGKIRHSILIKRIEDMGNEEKVLTDLIKKNQVERFKEFKISGIVYNIRMKKYQERLNEITRLLPVLKHNLSKIKK